MKIFRILGKRGRVTIPYEIRQRVGFKYNDVLFLLSQITIRLLLSVKLFVMKTAQCIVMIVIWSPKA